MIKLIVREFAGARLDMKQDADLILPVEPHTFGVAISNLLRNARTHGDADAPVDVVCGSGRAISIANDGPVTEAHLLSQLGAKFIARKYQCRRDWSRPCSGQGRDGRIRRHTRTALAAPR